MKSYRVYLPGFFVILSGFIGMLNIAMHHIYRYWYRPVCLVETIGRWSNSQFLKRWRTPMSCIKRRRGPFRGKQPRQCMPCRHMRHRHELSVETEHATYRNIRNNPNDALTQVGRFGSEVLGAWIELHPLQGNKF